MLLWLLDTLESERGKTSWREPVFVGPTFCPCLTPISYPVVYSPPASYLEQPEAVDVYRGRGRLPVLREVDDSDDDKYGSSSLLDERDLSALAEASMKLEELQMTVGRILFQVEQEQILNDELIDEKYERDDLLYEEELSDTELLEYEADTSDLEYFSRSFDAWKEVDRCSENIGSQITDLEQCAMNYGKNIDFVGCIGCGNLGCGSTVDDERSLDITSNATYPGDEANEYFWKNYSINQGSSYDHSVYENSCPDLCSLAKRYERDITREYDNNEENESLNNWQSEENVFEQEVDVSFESETYSARLSRIIQESTCGGSNFQPGCSSIYSTEHEIQPDTGNDTYSYGRSADTNCSIEDLEKCIDKLVHDVEREEARLRRKTSDRFRARVARFSMPMPPRPLSQVPRETLQGRASSMDSLLKSQSLSEIWWEGAYRNLTQTPDGQEGSRSGSRENTISPASSLTNFNLSEVEPVRAQIMLLVRTTEPGKDTIEIRSMRHLESPQHLNPDETRFSLPMSVDEKCQNQISNVTSLQKLFVHSPSVYELRSYSLEELCRATDDDQTPHEPNFSTLPGRSRKKRVDQTDPFPLEFSPPPSLVQYVMPVNVQPPDLPLTSSPTPCPVEYVTPIPGPTPGRGYCTWLPNPSPRGKASISQNMLHPPIKSNMQTQTKRQRFE